MFEVIIRWLIGLLRPLGLFRPEVVGRSLQGVCVVNGFPVPLGVLVHEGRASFSSEICRASGNDVTRFESGAVPPGLACVRKFEGRHRTSISLRFDFAELNDEIVQRVFPWLLSLSAELYQGYERHGVQFLKDWQPRRYEDDSTPPATPQ